MATEADMEADAPAGPWYARSLGWPAYMGVGLLWYATGLLIDAVGAGSETAQLWVAAMFMVLFAGLCLWNGRTCGSIHCQLSGYGYLGTGALAAGAALGLVPISRGVLFVLFGGVFVGSFAVEALVERRRAGPAAELS